MALIASVLVMFNGVPGLAGTPAAGADPAPVPAGWDPADLDPDPVPAWGVVGSGQIQSGKAITVFDFAEIGDRIYVAGSFTGVQRNGFDPASQVQPQAYLAAFDRDSGAWIPSFSPELNGTVYSLDVAPNGRLLAGGEFTRVNGRERNALVMLNQNDGATIASFGAQIESWWNGGKAALVREIEVLEGRLYVVGNFDHVAIGGGSYRVWSSTRLDPNSGALDAQWLPKLHFGAWDVDTDPARGKVVLSGDFDDIDFQPGTKSFATVSDVDGSVIPLVTPFERNQEWQTSQSYQPGVAFSRGRYWVAGAQHSIAMLNVNNHSRVQYAHTGMTCDTWEQPQGGCGPGSGAGGDYQVLEEFGNWIIAGCHCYEVRTQSASGQAFWNGRGTHYSSFDGERTNVWAAPSYNANTGETSSFVPGLARAQFGTYGIFVDSNGCLYVGGDYTRTLDGDWLGGFGKMCEPLGRPTGLTGTSANDTVRLTWNEPSSALPVTGYKVYRGTTFIGDTNGRAFTDAGAPPAGNTQQYRVVAVDSHGQRSDPRAVNVTISGGDNTAPGSPPNLNGTVVGDDNIRITWGPSTDDQGVKEYLVHRNYAYQGVVQVDSPRRWFADTNMAPGTYRYDIRARDFGQNLSAPSSVLVTVGADNEAPTVPPNVSAVSDGTEVTLTWDAAADDVAVTGYLIHRDYQYRAYVGASAPRRFVDDTVQVGTRYRYQVRAQDGGGLNSPPSAIQRATVGDDSPPSVPAEFTGTKSGRNVELNWAASDDDDRVTGYVIHRDYQYVQWVSGGASTSWTDTDLTVGQLYRWQVRAKDTAAQYSPPAPIVRLTI